MTDRGAPVFYDIKRREVIIHRYDMREKQNHDPRPAKFEVYLYLAKVIWMYKTRGCGLNHDMGLFFFLRWQDHFKRDER